MKKIFILITFFYFSLDIHSQEKIEIIGKVGYPGIHSNWNPGIAGGFHVGYLLHKKIGLFIGISYVRNNTFPNKNGNFGTGTYTFPLNSTYNELQYEILKENSNGYLTEYSSFSSISFDIGLLFKLIKNSKNEFSIEIQGKIANQVMHQLYTKKVSKESAQIVSIVENFSGVGFSPELRYSRKIYKSLYLGIYAEFTAFDPDSYFSSNYYDFGIFSSVAF